MSQDAFQIQMDKITDRLPGIIAINDNLHVFGKTPEDHDNNII